MMSTNVFRIGGLHHISWFQFLPNESELSAPPIDKAELNDGATYLVLSSCLQLQKEGFLSAWTNSFVGPWDPSQGLHNPDEKIKLWLFLPGRHSLVVETAKAAVSRLRVVASGLWLAPGDSEEVSVALSLALRNCVERALSGYSYMRFGDVFSKYCPYQSDKYLRKGQPTVEFIFAATEEAIFVHAIISAKNVRALSNGDVETAADSSFSNSSFKLPVIVSPHGMRGNLTGFCSNDLVKQVYFSSGSYRSPGGYIGLPTHVGRGSGCKMGGQNCCVEVKLGCSRSMTHKAMQSSSNATLPMKFSHESSGVVRGDRRELSDQLPTFEKTFIYPPEAVLVPVLQTPSTRSSLKRFWLQNWIGPSVEGSLFYMHWAGEFDSFETSGVRGNGISMQSGYNSSGNSNNSSISSTSSTTSDSDYKMTSAASDLEADADSLTCRQSGLSYNDQLDYDRTKMGSKRPRAEMTESFAQVGIGNDPIGSHWDWDDDKGVSMDIQALMLEFGDFGDFFENDVLPFGEPPGTAESQALALPLADSGDLGTSPVTGMDVSDQMLLPGGFPSYDSFNPVTSVMEECLNKNEEATISTLMPNQTIQSSASLNGEFDHLIKAEAIMSFAPEYGAVDSPGSELTSVFRRPYHPQSHKVESSDLRTNNYVYGATPPSSHFDVSDEKSCVSLNTKAYIGKNDRRSLTRSRNYYIQVEGKKGQNDKRFAGNTDKSGKKDEMLQWQLSNYNSTIAYKIAQSSKSEGAFSAGNIIFSSKTILATEVDCLMLQASMCRMRHLHKSSSLNPHVSLTWFSGNSLANQLPIEPMTDSISTRQEMKKNESLPIRIAGDIDGGILDNHHAAPDRVWRTVGFSKVAKPTDSRNMEIGSSLPHGSYGEERLLSYGQRQPLQELLDGIVLLVQQATSFIDVALDSECGDGPHGWLALQELWRRELSCGPSMVHAGCGGTLTSCHSLDISGVELMDPLSTEIHPSCVATMLQSDIKAALKSAFSALDGPLSVSEWCKGRSHSGDGGSVLDGSTAESAPGECRESSTATSMSVVEQMSPSQSVAVSSSVKVSSAMDGGKVEDMYPRKIDQDAELLRPTQFVLPSPAILVGYQDDWLKASPSSLQHWEKAPFEPYAVPKNVTYTVICPDIDPLTSAAADFFQQLGIVYETCRLGNHSPRSLGNQMEIESGKLLSSGFVLLDCPQSMKIESSNSSLLGSLSDYFLSLSNGWNVTSYLKSLSKALTALKLGSCLSTSQKEGSSSPCMVLYIVCPFPEPMAVLQTIVESSVAVGSIIHQSDKEKRSMVYAQVGRALNCSAAVDESSMSHIPVLSGFSIPKLVLQIVTVDSIFRITSPTLNELVILKEIAFAVYNKARRISRGSSNDAIQSSSLPSRSSVLTQMSSIQGIWKDCVGSRMTGSSLPREGEMDAGMRSGTWENSWQTSRSGGLSCDPNRNGDFSIGDEMRYMYEPLFILSEPGSVDHGVSPNSFGNMISESSKLKSDNSGRGFVQAASPTEGMNSGSGSQLDGSRFDDKALPSLHCCYGWTEDWRWLVSVWTDARGELLDSNIYPFGGISSRQDTKGLQCLFIQVLQQGCQILQACSSSDDAGTSRPRDFVITRIGNYFELEYQEWQKAIFLTGGPEVKKWPIQLRRSLPVGVVASNNGTSLQPQDIGLLQERTLPASASSLYSSHTKGFTKGGLGQSTGRKQVLSGQSTADMPSGLLQWVHSITFASVSIDHSLQLVCPTESPSPRTQNGNSMGSLSYLDSFAPVKSLGSTSVTYMLIPSPSMRFLQPAPLQLPTVLTADSPPLAHLLHSKGSAIPLATGFVVSKATPSMRKDHNRTNTKEEWPSVLSVGLVDYYGGYEFPNEKITARGIIKQQGGRTLSKETKEYELESHLILESVAAELHALSWMTVSPAYQDRRTALPFHCDMVMKLRRLLHFADKELSRQPDKPRG